MSLHSVLKRSGEGAEAGVTATASLGVERPNRFSGFESVSTSFSPFGAALSHVGTSGRDPAQVLTARATHEVTIFFWKKE